MDNTDKTSHAIDPELESLSAFCDGELDHPGPIEDGQARAIVDAYRQIDDAVLRSLTCPPDQQAAIISGSVARVRELNRPKYLQFSLQVVAGIAAAAIIVFSWRALQTPANPGPIIADLPPAEIVPAAPRSSVAPRPMPVGPGSSEFVPGTVNLSDLTLVSTNAGTPLHQTIGAPVGTASDTVGDRVRHVWLVQEATAPLTWLKPLLPGHEETLDHWIGEDSDSYRLQMTLTDRDLQGLVNRLADQGFALLSREAPQPGLFQQGSFSERPVVYEVHFVEK